MSNHPPHAANAPPARYVAQYSFPSFAYVPGKFPKSHAELGERLDEGALPPLRAGEAWQASDCFWFGVDLFNHGYYWEAHEAWEHLWHAAGRQGWAADFLKGLIKLAAAGVKAREEQARGVQAHARRANELFAGVAAHGQPIEQTPWPLDALQTYARQIATHAESYVCSSREPVVRVLPVLPIAK